MLMTILSYLPILLAPLLASALAWLLQRWVKPRSTASSVAATPTTTTALVPAPAPAASPARPTWDEIAAHTNPWVAYVLPVIASVTIVLLVLWPFAYLGWALIRLDADPGWGDQTPPWFGNLGYFLGFSSAGVMIALVGVLIITALLLGLHAIGKCILWPEVCGCSEGEVGDSRDGERGA